MKLQDKVAIITGAGRGLGRESAILMAKEGASLVVLSRTLPELKETAKAIKNAGGKVIYIKTDVSKTKHIEKVVERTLSTFGRIDILMNNAAIVGPIKPLIKVDEGDWDKTVAINLKSVYLISKAVVPFLIQQGGGKIINVTSGLGEMAMPLFGAYSITKAGLIHLTRILSEELKSYNIQVNALDPGVMDTRMQEEVRGLGPGVLGEEIYNQFLTMKESGRLKPPEKAAQLAVFLASEESDPITGENGTEDHYRDLGYKE